MERGGAEWLKERVPFSSHTCKILDYWLGGAALVLLFLVLWGVASSHGKVKVFGNVAPQQFRRMLEKTPETASLKKIAAPQLRALCHFRGAEIPLLAEVPLPDKGT